MGVLVIAEHNNQQILQSTYHAITAGRKIDHHVHVLVAGHELSGAKEEASRIHGIQKVLFADHELFSHPLAESLAPFISDTARDYTHVIAPATTFGKNLMPRISALLDVQQISDITAVIDQETFERPVYAGNAIATVKSKDAIKVLTIRTTKFDAVKSEGGNPEVEELSPSVENTLSSFVRQDLSESERPSLADAKVVISGGRGLGSAENFALLEKLADKLGAAIGASRAAVDAGYVPNDYQIGQTGKVVAPELYIAVGISGAIQHIAGMKDSKIIVAINKDGDAPIFQIADYGLCADLFEAIPELESKL